MNTWYIAALIALALGIAGIIWGWTSGDVTKNPDDYGGAIGGIILLVVGVVVAAVLALIGLVVG